MTTTVFNTKISEFEHKIPDNISLVTANFLNTKIIEVRNKIHDHSKYIAAQELKKLTAEKTVARLKQANLVSKTDFDNKLISFNRKSASNKTAYFYLKN